MYSISYELRASRFSNLEMKLSCSALVIAALGLECAIAQPAHHKHHHHQHRRDYDLSGVDWSKVDYSQPATKTDSSTTDSSATDSSPSSSCAGFGNITAPVDNGNKDEYIGNVGSPYGSNMKVLGDAGSCDCKYSIKLLNNGGASMEVIVWNKSGKDGKPQSGMGSDPNLKIPLGVGESQLVCVDENSQVAFSRNCQRNSVSNIPDCTWGEADFGDLRNGAWSGYDVSSIANSDGNTENLAITCAKGKTSSQAENSFTDVSQEDAGGAVAPGPMAIQAEWK